MAKQAKKTTKKLVNGKALESLKPLKGPLTGYNNHNESFLQG